MKITEVRTRVVQWKGKTVPLPPHFCTNPMDLLALPQAAAPAARSVGGGVESSMQTFTFHGWLIVEVFTDEGHVGIGNAALAPLVTKQVIDTYLSPLIVGHDPWDLEFLWQHMYRKTMAFGRKGIGMVAISAVDIALWDVLGKAAKQPTYRLLGGRTKARIPVYASRLYSTPLDELAAEAKRYKEEGYTAMKLRFGWGPADGAEGMRRNLDLVRTVRETVGDGIDIMADAYMGWTLDYAKRMLPLLEPFNLRWLEEPVIPDDINGYAELKAYGRVPIAGGEHEFTLHGFRDLLAARAVDYIQLDTNRAGGLTQARKIAALAEAYQVPVIPHAGQMHNYHLVMASLNSPMAEHFPIVDVEVGNELFWYIFEGEPRARGGYIDLDESKPGLGLTIDEERLREFQVIA
jgi:L-rhamnonate dehydratase